MDIITISQFKDICRVCLKMGALLPIFNYQEDLSTNNLLEKMKSCAHVELKKGDGLPSNICSDCINLLLKAYDFKIISEKSDKRLRYILQQAGIRSSESCTDERDVKDEPLEILPPLIKSTKLSFKNKTKSVRKSRIKCNKTNTIEIASSDDFAAPSLPELSKKNISKKTKETRKIKLKLEKTDLSCLENEAVIQDKQFLNGFQTLSRMDESETIKNELNEVFDCDNWINDDCDDKSQVLTNEVSDDDIIKSNLKGIQNEDCLKSDDDFDTRANCMDNFYGCLECKRQFPSRGALHSHMAGEHGRRGAEHRCYGCALVFPTKYRRSQHEKGCPSMPPGTRYHCRECLVVCETRKEFDLHIRRHRPAQAAPRATTLELGPLFPCPHCPKTLATHSSLYIHIQNHDKQNLVCEICGKCFKTRIRLMCHIKLHLNHKAFSCRECDFRTSTRNSLFMHSRKHSGERPYSCEVCGKRTATKSNLNSHQKRHTGVKDFKCDICGKTYMDKPPLEEHIIAVHAGLRPYDCTHCGATYTRKTGLRRHIKKRHPKGS